MTTADFLSSFRRRAPPDAGTNPEQLFDAGWSACFLSSIRLVAGRQTLRLPPDATIDAEVDLGMKDAEYEIAARLKIRLPGIDRATAQALVDGAHQLRTYSRATRGNVELTITLV